MSTPPTSSSEQPAAAGQDPAAAGQEPAAAGKQQPGEVLLQARPRRIVIYALIATVIIVGTALAVGIGLHGTNDGVAFRGYDQGGVIGVGVILGATIMIAAARPRLRVDSEGLSIRNMVGHRRVPWKWVQRISFPEGAQWPVVQMPDDETYPIVAIQAMDRERAVTALRQLRALADRYATDAPRLSEQAERRWDEQLRQQEQQRPLGRLELIDLQRGGGRRKRSR
ncbi:PH domain-containing protein [Nakamurella aerolata]|uniref:PH domain-containing protein n=1 Tax=Nakamurella aerolata TaxID=1656892 RepID=A0A849A9C4_9ACTN|nr:PH domain-containing protein [Nakamurella aerolata]NNG36216.1 PH domain-containing protein [Nakamurella aerolata]